MNYFNEPPTVDTSDPNVVKQSVTGANTSCYGTGGFGQYCFNRLPCGICMRTNSMCPIGGNAYPYPEVPTITWSNGTTTIKNPYTSTDSTEGSVKND